MQKRIQLQIELYDLMVAYIQDHYDAGDIGRYMRIMEGVEEKKDAVLRHMAYTAYKTSPDPEIKETARQIYLENSGIHRDFRW